MATRKKNTPKPFSDTTAFFWKMAGADPNLLKDCPMDEKAKYFGLGFLIVLLAILASFSGGYAAYTTTGNLRVSILLGFVWGLVILIIDRTFVSTMKKDKHNHKLVEVKRALPRIIIAVIIAMIISKPTEVLLLESHLDKFLWETNQEKLSQTYSDIENRNGLEKTEGKLGELTEEAGELEKINIEDNHEVISIKNEYNSCSKQWSRYESQITEKRREQNGIKAFKYAKMVSQFDGWQYKNKEYSWDELKQKFNDDIPSGVTSTGKMVNRVNAVGIERISTLAKQISSLEKRQRNLGCGSIKRRLTSKRTALEDDLRTKKELLNGQIVKTDSLLEITNNVIGEQKKVGKKTIEDASKGFVAKLIALNMLVEDKDYNFFEGKKVKKEVKKEDVSKNIREHVRDSIMSEFFHTSIKRTFTIIDSVGHNKEVIIEYVPKNFKKPMDTSLAALNFSNFFGKSMAWWISTAIMVFFLCLELLPISIKIISDYGVYDYKIDKQKKQFTSNN